MFSFFLLEFPGARRGACSRTTDPGGVLNDSRGSLTIVSSGISSLRSIFKGKTTPQVQEKWGRGTGLESEDGSFKSCMRCVTLGRVVNVSEFRLLLCDTEPSPAPHCAMSKCTRSSLHAVGSQENTLNNLIRY